MCCSAIGNGVQNVMTNVANFVRTLPSPGNVHRHVVVVTFILRRHQTNIQVEIQELENGVRATGLLCLLGISVGLGSIFVYRLYTRLFNSVPSKRKHRVSELCSTKSSTLCSDQNTPLITPDSGIVADGPAGKLPVPTDDTRCVDEPIRSPGHIRRCYSEFANLNGLHHRLSHSGSIEDILQVDIETHKQQLRRTWAVQNWLATVDTAAAASASADSVSDVIPDPKDMINSFGSRWSSADHGFVSGWMTESAEFLQEVSPPRQVRAPDVCQAPSLTSVSAITKEDGGCGRPVGELFGDQVQLFNMNSSLVRDSYPARKRRNSVSRMDDCRRWRRRRFSVASSVLSSEYEYRESLVSKGFSVDLGEDLEGMMTPPSEMDLTKHSGSMLTVDGMESLHLALRQIQRDIDDMNKKFDGLRSSAVLDPIGSCAELAESEEQRPNAVNFSCGNSENGDEESCSGRQELDFMWDYRSDLVTSGRGHRFVARRPVVAPSPAEYLRHHRLGLPRNFSDVGTEYSVGGAVDEGMQDMYIDDELLGTIASGLPSDFPPLPAVGERVGYKRSCDAMSDQSQSGSECSSKRSSHSHRSFHRAACRHGYMSDSESPNHSCSSGSRHAGGYSCNHSDSCCFGVHNHCGGSCDGRRSSQSNHACSHHHSHSNPANEHGAVPCRGHHHNCSSTSHCSCADQCHVPSARHTCAHACDHCNNVRPACTPDSLPRLVRLAMENFDSRDHCNNVSTAAAEETPSPTTFGRCVGDKLDVVRAADAMVLASQVAHKSCVDLLRLWNVTHVRSMLGDKNCMIRTVLYAALLNNQPILSRCGNLNECSQKLSCYADTRHKYLCCWNVMELNSNVDRSVTDKLVECLKVLYEQVEIIGRLSTVSQRDQYLSALLNGSQEIDRQMMEAVKVLVMLDLIAAYEDFVSGASNSGPFVVWQILSRDTSLTAEMFFHNYLNNVRDGITLFTEQLELSFLAHTLGLRLQVFQPSHAGHSDALRHYPDEGADHLSLVRIIRCDDPARYYIPVGC